MLKSKLAVAVVAALAFGYSSAYAGDLSAQAATGSQQDAASAQQVDANKAKKLQTITVTGSLIPQTQVETATPIITITAADMKARGFTTVAQALQQASFATGSVQGMQDTNSFTTGAETLSMFGLPVGFTKYLIDGRPMGNFPGLYNGSDTFNSISGIPMDMVDHIDILPGGQSSLYGSDAIAGVINIVLKKHIDAPVVDARYGWHTGGGGADRRISFADSFSVGAWNSLVGVQVENTSPIWTRDRDLTKQFYTQGTTPATASRDYLFTSAYNFADPHNLIPGSTGYQFLDPDNCANVSSQWGGTEGKQYRQGSGYYCGSQYTPGAGTVQSGKHSASFYTHNTVDISDNVELYGDLLYSYSDKRFTNGSSTMFWGSNVVAAAAGGGYYYDPGLQRLMLAQHAFSPEEVGGYQHIMNKEVENSYMLTFGAKGTFGQSNWDYDLGFTHSDDKLLDHTFQRFALPMEKYFSTHVLGPQQGTYSGYPVFEPNYAGLYEPVSNSDFRSFTGYTDSYSKTWDNLIRGQLTNTSLFSLPGGDAGIAVVLEGGNEGWDSTPDSRLLQTVTINGNQTPYVWGTSATPGAGHRSRYAATTEVRLPLLKQVTMDVSGRYDSYKVSGKDVSHGTYNLGIEYRPFDSLLLRGRYGTAFKVPTLSDEYQRPSGYYNSVFDYLNCGRLGFSGANASKCPAPFNGEQFSGTTYGNPALKPITAKVWSYGVVWAPLERMSVSVDYLHWDISNEVNQLSSDGLSNDEYLCDIGTYDATSTKCTTAFSLITRGPGSGGLLGQITNITTPKVNVSKEQVNAITAHFAYIFDIGRFGNLTLNASYSDELKHTYQDYPQDKPVDELRHPGYSTDFKTKGNASLTWMKDKWSTTLYVNRYGSTPNYLASQLDSYTKPGTGKLAPWVKWNASVTYNPMENLGLSLLVNNLFDKMPPVDHSYPGTTGTPYNTDNYDVFGRAIYLEANYKFGKGG
ncbi:TonB-dependent receptor domain-containing protein [Rhodanobacter glycinis]|uniref:TonB-dependent Receptor Plug Domain n=3 Tax=Bacteria TaxID=2 RepID=A0A1I4AXG8_9GAMM|nr:TonB-dependent receptor [Rhodanobacter glycinis]SFK60617.1 TonB-dependent Receptor Plug Domain [Rhodanobacter glycinis]